LVSPVGASPPEMIVISHRSSSQAGAAPIGVCTAVSPAYSRNRVWWRTDCRRHRQVAAVPDVAGLGDRGGTSARARAAHHRCHPYRQGPVRAAQDQRQVLAPHDVHRRRAGRRSHHRTSNGCKPRRPCCPGALRA